MINSEINVVNIQFNRKLVYVLDQCGKVYYWGNKQQLTDDQKIEPKLVEFNYPTDVDKKTIMISIATGYDHGLALDNFGRVWSWGQNNYGQLGNGSIDNKDSPSVLEIFLEDPIKQIYAERNCSYAISANKGLLYVWGDNRNSQLGVFGTDYVENPVVVQQLPFQNCTDLKIVQGKDNSTIIYQFQPYHLVIGHYCESIQNEQNESNPNSMRFKNDSQISSQSKVLNQQAVFSLTFKKGEKERELEKRYEQLQENIKDYIEKIKIIKGEIRTLYQQIFNQEEVDSDNDDDDLDQMTLDKITQQIDQLKQKKVDRFKKQQINNKDLDNQNVILEKIKVQIIKKNNEKTVIENEISQDDFSMVQIQCQEDNHQIEIAITALKKKIKENTTKLQKLEKELNQLYVEQQGVENKKLEIKRQQDDLGIKVQKINSNIELLLILKDDKISQIRSKQKSQNKKDLQLLKQKFEHLYLNLQSCSIQKLAIKQRNSPGICEILDNSEQILQDTSKELKSLYTSQNDPLFELVNSLIKFVSENISLKQNFNDLYKGLIAQTVQNFDKQQKKIDSFIHSGKDYSEFEKLVKVHKDEINKCSNLQALVEYDANIQQFNQKRKQKNSKKNNLFCWK